MNKKAQSRIYFLILLVFIIGIGYIAMRAENYPENCKAKCTFNDMEYYMSKNNLNIFSNDFRCICLKDNYPYEIPLNLMENWKDRKIILVYDTEVSQ